jgi:hypothetical protein
VSQGGFGVQRVANRPLFVTVFITSRLVDIDRHARTKQTKRREHSDKQPDLWRRTEVRCTPTNERDRHMKLKSKSGAVLGALIAAALVSASAATLGAITTNSIGAQDTVIASCDTDGITSEYSYAYDEAAEYFEVDTVILGNINVACDGGDLSVALGETPANELTNETDLNIVLVDGPDVDIILDDYTITLTTAVQAEAVTHLAVVISV